MAITESTSAITSSTAWRHHISASCEAQVRAKAKGWQASDLGNINELLDWIFGQRSAAPLRGLSQYEAVRITAMLRLEVALTRKLMQFEPDLGIRKRLLQLGIRL